MSLSRFTPRVEIDPAKLPLIGLAVIVAAILLRLLFLYTSLVNLPVTSDEASSVLLAKMIARGEFPLLFIGQPYQFPVESYLMAPFVEWMPRTPVGARYQAIILGALAFWGFVLIIRTAFLDRTCWPALLLVCFPSAYFLIYQAAYAPPQYSISLTLAWISILAVLRSRLGSRTGVYLAIAGLACGLALSNHLLTVTISVGVFALILFSGSLGRSFGGLAVFIFCCLLGALPYILALVLIPGAYHNLPNSVSFIDALGRMINPGLSITLPGAMGVNPIVFPDLGGYLNWSSSLGSLFAIFYGILFISLGFQRIKLFAATTLNRRWPRLELVDLALITSLLSLWVFASHLTPSSSYRYLLPAVWCFPFLVGHAFFSFSKTFRSLVGTIAICLALFNIGVALHLIREWSDHEKLTMYSHTADIGELVETLYEEEITHCYASFWLAYRITFETDEDIICSLPYNQRFPLWPIPYKQQVEKQPDTVYVLTQRFRPRLPAKIFEKHLNSHDIAGNKIQVGPFFIYHDFTFPSYEPDHEVILDTDQYSIESDGGNSSDLVNLADENHATVWRGGEKQVKGQSVTLDFNILQTINGVTLFHLPGISGKPESLRISGYQTMNGIGSWHPLTATLKAHSERLRFVNNHPVYSGLSQQIRFEPVKIEALRIEIVEPKKDTEWGMTEIEVSALQGDG